MKSSFIIGLASFWTIVVVIMGAGFVSYENQKLSAIKTDSTTEGVDQSGQHAFDPLNPENGVPLDPAMTADYMTSAYIGKHSTEADCWLIVNDKIYDVSDYIPFHPGGKKTIIPLCGQESTKAFTSRGGTGKHSSNAWTLLENYYVADLNSVIPGTERPISPVTGDPSTGTGTTDSVSGAVGTSKFSIGDRVIAIDGVSVRKQPGAAGTKLSTQLLGARGTVKGVSAWADDSWWAYVSYTDGSIGWSSETYLKKSVEAPVASVPTVPIKPIQANTSLTSTTVATHSTKSSCWLIINNKVYDVTQYIPFHPGGQSTITPYCGKEATNAFNTKGGGGSSHSSNANSLLANYYLGTIGTELVAPVIPTTDTTAPTVSFLSPTKDALLSGTVAISAFASDASGVSNVKFSIDGTTLKTDSTSPYSASLDTTGYSNAAHTLKLDATDKAGNTNSASLSVSISNVALTPTTETLTSAVVATHNTKSSCYLIINNKVYDVTQYIPFHPGGQTSITNHCGKESTNAFNTKDGGGSHSSNANTLLANYYIGTIGTAPVTPVTPTTCSSFTYGSWSACQSDSTQSRAITSSSPSGCTGGSPVLTQSCTYTPPVVVGTLTSAVVATHNSSGNCWLIINSKVYDVTQYIPFHPGGQSTIITYCGKEATNAFNTKGGGGSSHSSNANSLLANYYIGTLGAATASCTSFTYSAWGTCGSNSTQTRTVNSSSPSGCTGGSPVTSQSCTYTPPVAGSCTSFTYGSWSACQSDSTQSRAILSTAPAGCTGGSPVLTQSCTYTPPSSGGALTSAAVATHNTASDCYLIVNNKVYDVTQYIPFHPGGASRITSRCGTEATSAFVTNSAGHAHSASATTLLNNYYVGDLSTGTGGGTTPTTCSSFTYSAWGTCGSNSTQSRSVTSSSPSGCTGGSPVTSQSCTYTPPSTGNAQTYTVGVSSSGSFDQTSLTINAGDSIKFVYSGSGGEAKVNFTPSTISRFTLDEEKQTKTVSFTTPGTWTAKVSDKSGNTLTVTVQ